MTNVADAHPRDPAADADAAQGPAPAALKSRLEARLEVMLPPVAHGPGRLVEAMHYALLAPAKRARGVLAVLAVRQFGGDPAHGLTTAGAIEMVHAASLVLDDLPCMDDAALRRGRPACHRVYGEDTATLAAVALMNQAFQVLVTDPALAGPVRLELARRLAEVIGPDGLTGGQEEDLRNGGNGLTAAAVEGIHLRKTAVLFGLAAEAGARIAGADGAAIAAMRAFGDDVGTAFQSLDDLLDAEASPAAAAKDVGKDAGKATLVTLLGRDGAVARVDGLVARGLAHLAAAGGDHAATGGYVQRIIDELVARRAQG